MKNCYSTKGICVKKYATGRSVRKCIRREFLILFLFFSCYALQAQHVERHAEYNLIPYPAGLKAAAGNFVISSRTVLVRPGNAIFNNEVLFLQQLIQNYLGAGALQPSAETGQSSGKTLQPSAGTVQPSGKAVHPSPGTVKGAIVLKYDPSLAAPEAYTLVIEPANITMAAGDPAGMFYAIETLRQLLPAGIETGRGGALTVPCVQITDQPAFSWRGMMLDVSRHFFSIAYLEKYADMMALYKLNKLHLHLTDDQGWRIEIKKYPRLTAESGWRTFNNQDSACMRQAAATGNGDLEPDQSHVIQKNGQTLYGGFYTQEEMRGFIRYAASRHIEVIPEIDMPGHMMAAARIYPELTCDTLVSNNPNDFSNPICPCNENALEFAKDVFSEIADLFPSQYIHIGGDEVNKKNWAKSPVVQAFMKERGFTDMNQVQSYFNDYMLAFFRSKQKKLLGWDEIIEGGIDSSAAMMFWRAWAPGAPAQAAKNHNKIVMTPDGPLYFDAISDAQTLPAVYNYDPFDTGLYHLDGEAKKYILGVQANLWTEMIPSEKRADYMTMPRLTALAEIGWTHRYEYASYVQRLNAQYDRLDLLNIHYRLPDINDLAENYAIIGKTPFYAASPNPRFKVRYTLDGTLPDAHSPLMDKPVVLDHAVVMKLALFTPAGRGGDVYKLTFHEQQFSGSGQANVSGLKDGLRAAFYKGEFPRTAAIKGNPDSIFSVTGVTVPNTIKAPAFGLKFSGFIQAPETGIYTFYLTCNDGGVLYIGDQKIIDNDGLHSDKTKGGQAGLQKGLHPISVDFMEYGGGYALDLKYSYKGSEPKPVPASWFKSGTN